MRHLVSLLAALAAFPLAPPAHAALPGPLLTAHPHILSNADAMRRLASELVQAPLALPRSGVLRFDILASHAPTAQPGTPVFDGYDCERNHVFVRHEDSADTADSVALQIALQAAGACGDSRGMDQPYVAVAQAMVPAGKWTPVELSWDEATHRVSVSIAGRKQPLSWARSTGDLRHVDWRPDGQRFGTGGRPGELLRKLTLADGRTGEVLVQATQPDPLLSAAWSVFRARADGLANALLGCTATAGGNCPPAPDLAAGHPDMLLDLAQSLALAWRIAREPRYLDAADSYAARLMGTPPTAGGEYTMAGRVAAMGLLYDWLYDDLPARRAALAQAIRATITARDGSGRQPLGIMICGNQYLSSAPLACAREPSIEPGGGAPSIGNNYIGGHNYADVAGIAIGLLAIAGEYRDVSPLLDTAWTHFERGFWPARAWIGVDGASHMGFAYGAAYNDLMPLRLWRAALVKPDGVAALRPAWAARLVLPYVYGLRAGYDYPANGDDFGMSPIGAWVPDFALWAANMGGDASAADFYHTVIEPRRGHALIWDRLFWPKPPARSSYRQLDTARHFRNAGLVLARDTWDMAGATLLGFSSASFTSENHQHLDQNGLSLFHHAPLLLDSGLYDSYGSTHWHHYYRRSIAHNTVVVFDPAERFLRNGVEYANDGGQWIGDSQAPYPTLAQAMPGGANHLDGIVGFESTPGYTYAAGDASKAYQPGKLERDGGFVRQWLFLPRPGWWPHPVVLMFDTVRKPAGREALETTLLLHAASRPTAGVASQAIGPGRQRLDFGPDAKRMLTLQNGAGMLHVQTLLPERATITLSGGTGQACRQGAPGSPGDCRFLVRQRQADGRWQWTNFPPQSGSPADRDAGAWRIEVNPADNAREVSFLHVLSIADTGETAVPPVAQRLTPCDAGTEAVLLGGSYTVGFSRSRGTGNLCWNSPLRQSGLLLSGLAPDTGFRLEMTPLRATYRMRLVQDTKGPYRSSAQGVISAGMR